MNTGARLRTGTVPVPKLYKVYINKLLPANIMSYIKTINACHNHNVRMEYYNFKIKFSRTTKKSECIRVKGPKMWNDIPADIKLCKAMFTFKKMYKALLLQLINLVNCLCFISM